MNAASIAGFSPARVLTTAVMIGATVAGCGSTASPSATSGATASPTATPRPATPTPAPSSPATVTGNLLGAFGPGDWPTYGHDHANSVNNQVETALSPETVGNLVEAWHLDTGGVTATPVIVAGIVYFGDWLGDVYAVDAKSGAVAWTQHVTEAPISASAAISDELVIVGDLAGGLHALHRSDGSPAWSTTVNPLEASLFASPVVVNDTVVIDMTDSELHEPDDPSFRASIVAFSLADGSERWRFYTDPKDSPGLWVSMWSTPAGDPDREMLYVGTGSTNEPAGLERAAVNLPLSDGVLAIEADTGKRAWFHQVVLDDGLDLDVGASPNLFRIGDRDVVGAGGKSGDYVVLDRDTGDLVWQTHLTQGSDGGGVMETAAVGDGHVYVASNENGGDATIYALSTADGAIDWQQPMDDVVRGGSMALANGVLYRGLWDGPLLALDASDGHELWRSPTTSFQPLGGGPAVVDGMLYSGYGSGGGPGAMQAPAGGLVAWRLP